MKPAAFFLPLCLSACAMQTAATRGQPAAIAQAPVSLSRTPYYVEFRARPSVIGGHTYLVYGALGRDGQPAEQNLIGFLPEGGIFGLLVGMIAAPGELGRGFLDEKVPDIDTYRRYVTADQYKHFLAFIADEQRQTKVWNMFVNNCNDFAAEAALAIGLKVPSDRFVPPPLFVLLLSRMNT